VFLDELDNEEAYDQETYSQEAYDEEGLEQTPPRRQKRVHREDRAMPEASSSKQQASMSPVVLHPHWGVQHVLWHITSVENYQGDGNGRELGDRDEVEGLLCARRCTQVYSWCKVPGRLKWLELLPLVVEGVVGEAQGKALSFPRTKTHAMAGNKQIHGRTGGCLGYRSSSRSFTCI
jgi:hypothetical protein